MRVERNCFVSAGIDRKAQAGVEYIFIVAFLLAVLTPIFIYSLDIALTSVKTARSKDVVESIAIASDNICSMGGGKTDVDVYLPYGVQYYVIDEKTVKLGIDIDGNIGEAFSRTLCNVTGSIPLREGYARIPVSMLPNGTILINGTGI